MTLFNAKLMLNNLISLGKNTSKRSLYCSPTIKELLKSSKNKQQTILSTKNTTLTNYQFLQSVYSFANCLKSIENFENQRVALVLESSIEYVVSMFAAWANKATVVPISPKATLIEIGHYLKVSRPTAIITSKELADKTKNICNEKNIKQVLVDFEKPTNSTSFSYQDGINLRENALIIFTSGTTNLPKGVVLTHGSLLAQIESMTKAWQMNKNDKVLHFLPLHHIHGIVNGLLLPLHNWGKVHLIKKFNVKEVFDNIEGNNILMGVPTMYARMIEKYENMDKEKQKEINKGIEKYRICISGSASLSKNIYNKWLQISGYIPLLERYGMSETGMIISNPLNHELRKQGSVGVPLPGVEVRLVDENNNSLITTSSILGEIQTRSSLLFKEYFDNREATKKSFTEDNWFMTGDMGSRDSLGYYRISGRISIDIIKRGGHKISALEIESLLGDFCIIKESAVFGVDDENYGENIVCAFVLNDNATSKDQTQTIGEVKSFLNGCLSSYKLPSIYKILQELPRNSMGKIDKKKIKSLYF